MMQLNHPAQIRHDPVLENCIFYISPSQGRSRSPPDGAELPINYITQRHCRRLTVWAIGKDSRTTGFVGDAPSNSSRDARSVDNSFFSCANILTTGPLKPLS